MRRPDAADADVWVRNWRGFLRQPICWGFWVDWTDTDEQLNSYHCADDKALPRRIARNVH
jgi:hypothetical protein